MSQYILYRITKDTQPVRALIAPASIPLATIHDQLRPGERIAWTGNLADALGLPVTWLDRQKERQRQEVLKAVQDLRGRGQTVVGDPVREVMIALFLGNQPWRDTCWKCSQEINPILEKCPQCGADVLPF